MPLSNGFWTLLVMYAIMAIGTAFAMPAATAYVVEEGRIFGMGASMALFMMAMQIGNGLGPIMLGGIADWLGIESTFYSAAIILLLGIAAFIWLTRKPSPKITTIK
jgi:MFS family permease